MFCRFCGDCGEKEQRDEGLSSPGFLFWRLHPKPTKMRPRGFCERHSGNPPRPWQSGHKAVASQKPIPVCPRNWGKSWCEICWENLVLNMEILGRYSATEELKFKMSSCIHLVPTFWFIPVDVAGLNLPAPTCLHQFQSHR